MKKYSFALVALAAALAITPSAMADTWHYTIDGANFSSDLILTTSGTNGNSPLLGAQYITDVQGIFDITGHKSVWFGTTATEIANTGSNGGSLTTSSDGGFLFDNLLYTPPGATGNEILDWGGFLVDINGYELNIFSGASGSGAPGLGNPGGDYFYFADNGAYHYNDPIPARGDPGNPANSVNDPGSQTLTHLESNEVITPEPGSLFLLGTGLLGFALLLFRKASKPSSSLILS